MKKILGILMVAVICILGLCSCTDPKIKVASQDTADKIATLLAKGEEIEVKGKHVYLFSLVDGYEINVGNQGFRMRTCFYTTNLTRLVQYNSYFEIYIGSKIYTFSNDVAGYSIK